MQQPSRSDEQELKVLKKRGFFAFNRMSDKLTNPGNNKNDDGH
jgi:hypothetical protein